MNLSEKILLLRKQKGFSQEQLAERLGISRQAVSKWESGQAVPDIDKIINISDLFNVSTDYLLKDKTETIEERTMSCPKVEPQKRLSVQKIVGIIVLSFSLLSFILAFFAEDYTFLVVAFAVLLMIIALELLFMNKASIFIILWSAWGYYFVFVNLFIMRGFLRGLLHWIALIVGIILIILSVGRRLKQRV
jgi:transcriptional regulator with XRE-family HTH domain